jgi:hypothetical protein
MKILTLAALAIATVAPQAQGPVRDLRTPAPPPTGTGVIRGMVVADATGGAIRLAHVVVIGALTGTLRVTSTDAEGRFAIASLAADRYVIAASKPPYLGAIAGARRPARPGSPVVLAAGQTIDTVSIRLPMGAAISGTIADERGQPGAGVTLALQQWRNEGGARTLVMARTPNASTDERGRYRFFGLPPGEYVVVAMDTTFNRYGRQLSNAEVDAALKGAPVTAEPPLRPSQSAPIYYPGTPRPDDAAGVVVNAGDDRQGVDFRLQSVRPGTVNGVVVTSDGAPAAGASIEFRTTFGSVLSMSAAIRVGADGSFGLAGVVPGSYFVLARGSGPTAGQSAAATLDVAGDDVARLTLTLRPALTLTGRVAFAGSAAPALGGRRVPVQTLTRNTINVSPGPTDANGVFSIATIPPGRYVIGGPIYFGASPDSVTWTLESVVADGRDITDLPLEIVDAVPKEVVVTYGERWQELSGRLTAASGVPAPDFTVIAFPADKAYWLPSSRRIVTARPGTNGEFVLSGPGLATLPAGDYLIAAVTDIDRNEQFDPAFLATLVPAAVPVKLTPGGKIVQDLRIR